MKGVQRAIERDNFALCVQFVKQRVVIDDRDEMAAGDFDLVFDLKAEIFSLANLTP